MSDATESPLDETSPSAQPPPHSGPKRRRWRIGAIGLGAAVLLIGALYLAAVVAFPPERLAVLLAEQVKAATGRDFRIDGGLSLHFLPTVSVRARDIVLANAEWGSRPEMLRARRAAFEVSLKALLDRQIRILRVDVEGVDALLESDGAGRFNWQFAPRPVAGAQGRDAARATPLPLLDFERITLADVRIAYRDDRKAAPRTLAIESLDLQQGRGDRDRLAAAFTLGPQRWTAGGEVGPLGTLLAGAPDWPFDLRLATDGATLTASGNIGTGPRAGSVAADVSARVTTSAALKPWTAGGAELPLPLELRTRLQATRAQLRADPLHLSLAGQSIDGRATLHAESPRPRIDAELSAASIDLAAGRSGTSAAKSVTAAPVPATAFFDDTPLPFGALPDLALQLALKVEQLRLPGLPPLSALRVRLASAPDRLALDGVQFGIAGGQVHAQAKLALGAGAAPRLDLSLDAKSLAVDALLAASAANGQLRGGHADLATKLAMTGRTPKALAASASGELLFSAADVSVAGGAAALERNVIVSLLRLLVPTEAAGRPLVVECAVANLPLRSGVAVLDRSIAMETREVAVVASGTLNLVEQTIRLEFQPTVKKGLGLNPSSLAQLVLLHGPLHDPEVGVDVAGAVREAGRVGVAVATAGLSLVVPRVVKGSDGLRACGQAALDPPAPTASDEKARPRLLRR